MATAPFQTFSKPPTKSRLEPWFFRSMALAMIGVSLLGFLPAILHPVGRRAPLSALAAVHGLVFFAWLLLFLVQASLIATRHVAWHRCLGVASVVLLALMIPLGFLTTLAMVRRGYDLSGDIAFQKNPAEGAVFTFINLLLFGVLAIAALVYRRRPELHKRLILFANIELMPSPLAHLMGHIPRLATLPGSIILVPMSVFVFAAVGRDLLGARRIHPLTWCLAALVLFSGPIEAGPIGTSAAWGQFVEWLAH